MGRGAGAEQAGTLIAKPRGEKIAALALLVSGREVAGARGKLVLDLEPGADSGRLVLRAKAPGEIVINERFAVERRELARLLSGRHLGPHRLPSGLVVECSDGSVPWALSGRSLRIELDGEGIQELRALCG